MAEQIFPGQIDLKRVKFLVEQTVLAGVCEGQSLYARLQQRILVAGAMREQLLESYPVRNGAALSSSSDENFTEQEGEADIPVVIHKPSRRSADTPYSLI